MKKLRTFLSLLLVVLTLASCFAPITASAASNNTDTNYSKYNQPETKGDYAYYKSGKVVKSGSTSVSEVKWMQAALNYCIKNEGLNTSYISVDGSFGPASQKATVAFQKAAGLSADGSFGPSTIKKMIDVLNDNKKTFKPVTVTSTKNISSKCNIIKTYKIGNTKYYVATLKTNYNGVKKGTTVFLNSNYTAVTNTDILEKLLFTHGVDSLSKESNGFENLTKSYQKVIELYDVCMKIIEAQSIQKCLGSAAGSFSSIMLSSNPKALIASGEYLTEEAYVTMMTVIYLGRISAKAETNSRMVTEYCQDGIASYEEAKKVENALIEARTAFLIADSDAMFGLVNGYSNKKNATLNSLKTFFTAMCNTLVEAYSGKIVKALKTCSTGESYLKQLNTIFGGGICAVEACETFKYIFDTYVTGLIEEVTSTQNKIAK